jgi:hypothetical protein
LIGIFVACLEHWIIAEVLSMARVFSIDNTLSNVVTSNVVTLVPRANAGARDERPCIAGLSYEETIEFEALDAIPPLDDDGNVVWPFEGEPVIHREKRWLELYRKHDRALKPTRF